MKRLPSHYASILDKIEAKYDLDKIRDYNQLIKTYNNINKILQEQGCEIYDLNCVLKEYALDTKHLETVKKLRKFVNRKNREIARKTIKSDVWSKYVNELHKDTRADKNLVEKSLLKTMKQYSNNWMGYWTIIDVSEKGLIKDVNLFSPDDYKRFLKNLKK